MKIFKSEEKLRKDCTWQKVEQEQICLEVPKMQDLVNCIRVTIKGDNEC